MLPKGQQSCNLQVGRAAVDTADTDGWTPLIIAASAGHSQLVDMLLGHSTLILHLTSPGDRLSPHLTSIHLV